MAQVKLNGTAWDGDYEFDFQRRRTARELYHFKQVAKVGWDELGDTIREGSGPLVVAGIAVLALVRAGKIAKEQALHVGDLLLDLEEGEIQLILDPPVEAASPPAETPTPEASGGGSETTDDDDANASTSSPDSETHSEESRETIQTAS